MTYIDEFEFKKENFDFGKYFTLSIDPDKNWDISYDDFFLGIVPYQEQKEKTKLVFRLRTIAQNDENYLYSLETSFMKKDSMIEFDGKLFPMQLDHAHDIIITYFIDFLTKDYQNELNLDYTEIDI